MEPVPRADPARGARRWTRRACACASSAAATASRRRSREEIEWAEQLTARHSALHACSSASTTAAAPRSCTRPSATAGGGEEEFRRHLYAPDLQDPELIIRTGRRAAPLELPALGVRLLGALLLGQACGRTSTGRSSSGRSTRFGAPGVPLRRPVTRRRRATAERGRRAARAGDLDRRHAVRGRDPVGRRSRSRSSTSAGRCSRVALIGLGVRRAARALHDASRPVRPIPLAGFAGAAGLILAAAYGDQYQMVLASAASVLLAFLLALRGTTGAT